MGAGAIARCTEYSRDTPKAVSSMGSFFSVSQLCGTDGQQNLGGTEQLSASQLLFLTVSGLGMGVGQLVDKQTL